MSNSDDGAGGGYGMFGVDAKRKEHPSISEDKVGFAKIDAQRMFTSTLGNQAMGAHSRQNKAGDGATVNRAKPGNFHGRRRTLSKG